MRIDAVDLFYLAMPEVTLDADGSQDALLVRVVGDDGSVGWGESEASPVPSIAAFVTPRSHGVCQPVSASVIGQQLNSPADIARISAAVQRNSMDLLQAPHLYSGIEAAMWDLLGKSLGEPAWRLLGYDRSYGKLPYASMLFGADPDETARNVGEAVARGFRAVKVGWGVFGTTTVGVDEAHLEAARGALGDDGTLLVDAGQIFVEDVEAAAARLAGLDEFGALWLEEPFVGDAYGAYAALASRGSDVRMAGGEAAHNARMATNIIDYGNVGFVQIDCGRIGGLGPAKLVADHAVGRGVTFVNHTFTSHLALSASLQPFAGLADHRICEFPSAPRALAVAITSNHLEPDENGLVFAPDAPGLGMDVDLDALAEFEVPVRIEADDALLFESRSIITV